MVKQSKRERSHLKKANKAGPHKPFTRDNKTPKAFACVYKDSSSSSTSSQFLFSHFSLFFFEIRIPLQRLHRSIGFTFFGSIKLLLFFFPSVNLIQRAYVFVCVVSVFFL